CTPRRNGPTPAPAEGRHRTIAPDWAQPLLPVSIPLLALFRSSRFPPYPTGHAKIRARTAPPLAYSSFRIAHSGNHRRQPSRPAPSRADPGAGSALTNPAGNPAYVPLGEIGGLPQRHRTSSTLTGDQMTSYDTLENQRGDSTGEP